LPAKIPVSRTQVQKNHRVPTIMRYFPHPMPAILIPASAGFSIDLIILQNGL
jgi:hypothetical protein